MGMEAPIIFLQPPPLTPADELEVDRCVECELEHMNEEESAAMKVAKAYELQKLGEVNANSLDELHAETKKTKSQLSKRKEDRESIYNDMKKKGRELAKTGDKKLHAQEKFLNKDLERKDKEIHILTGKLRKLKEKESIIIRQHPAKEAKEEADEEGRETEGESVEEGEYEE
eukprot:GHVS01007997.1.p1 GENE.GHVS01007997.1~~GHVS01007997.1.p1  ORF type:complete len:172 (+),score=39.41 GHVS01007997.1:116-631(+)